LAYNAAASFSSELPDSRALRDVEGVAWRRPYCKGERRRSFEDRIFSASNGGIIEVDLTRIGSACLTVAIANNPVRSAPLRFAAARTKQTAAADKANRK
jgi:hypothetical protein